ncbi:MAG: tetratricopeptide repeat protein [Rhodothermales bacterium]
MSFRTWPYFIIVLIVASGCGKGSFLGKRYDNFTAYYNTFYNAKKEYRTGLNTIERAGEKDINRNQYLPIFITPDRVSSQTNFDDAIKKSADVLRENPNSKWVDDALLLIGQSYFYLKNYVGAEQKFQEVIDLGGELEDESRFWLGRTLIASNDFSRGLDHLEVSLNREGVSRRWLPHLRMALAELYVKQESWADAITALEQSIERMGDKGLASRAQFLAGQVYETMGQHGNAIQSYSKVLKYKPDYPLVYAAQISRVRVEGFFGEQERALRLLRGMERDDKNFESRGEMMYFRGRILQAMSRPDQAYDIYHSLLFSEDRTLNASAVKGHIHYAMGELYRDDFVDFSYAAAHFDTSKSALNTVLRAGASGSAALQQQYAPEAITDSERQAEVFGSFAEVYDEIAHLDSLLYLGDLDEESFDAFILDLRRKRAEEMVEEQREIARRQAEQGFQNIATTSGNRSAKVIDGPFGGSGNKENGFLFYKDQIRVQESRISFISIWGDRPYIPNWRRQDAIQNANTIVTSGDSTGVESPEFITSLLDENLLPAVDYSEVPRTPERIGEVESDLALVRYELANVLFLSMERPDSAAAWYRLVIDEAHHLPVAQRAFYALAEVHRALGDQQAASRLYDEVVSNYPDSDFANQARERLGLAAVAQQETDSLALAELAYANAYKRWQDENYEQAVSDMVMLASNYAVPDVASRALLATGSIYLEWAERDRLDVRALPLPLVPDSLLWSYGLVDTTSIYTAPAASGAEQALADILAGVDTSSPEFYQAGKMVLDADSLQRKSEKMYNDSDSLYVLSDSYYGQDDKQALSDSLYKVSEAMQLGSDLLFKRADSLRTTGEELLAGMGLSSVDLNTLSDIVYPKNVSEAGDSTGGFITYGKYLKLEGLFSNIKERFPQTPHADFADQMLRAMIELRPLEDSTIVQELAEEDMERLLETMPEDEKYIRMPGEIDLEGEGWTLVVASFSEQERAESVVVEYQDKGYKSAVFKGGTKYRVGVGQYPDLDTAKAGLLKFKEELPPTTWYLDIQKVR